MPAGAQDRRGVCRQDAPESCGQSGFCNGLGGCAKYAAGFVCRSPRCEGNNQLPASLCDGEGTCIPGGAIACAPSICEANACRSACDSDAQCVSPNRCVDGSCGEKGLGQSCGASTECDSAFCVDGVCCESACVGRCTFCASPETLGRCLMVRAGAIDLRAARGDQDPSRSCVDQGPASCAGNGRCDGQGGCQRYADGTVCREPTCDAAANSAVGAGTCLPAPASARRREAAPPFRAASATSVGPAAPSGPSAWAERSVSRVTAASDRSARFAAGTSIATATSAPRDGAAIRPATGSAGRALCRARRAPAPTWPRAAPIRPVPAGTTSVPTAVMARAAAGARRPAPPAERQPAACSAAGPSGPAARLGSARPEPPIVLWGRSVRMEAATEFSTTTEISCRKRRSNPRPGESSTV